MTSAADAADFDLAAYDFVLPEAQIASRAVEPRHAARLLAVSRSDGTLRDLQVADLPDLLPAGALLVVNDTRVVPARLLLQKASGGAVECLLEAPFGLNGDRLDRQPVLYKTSKALRQGTVLDVLGHSAQVVAHATVAEVQSGGRALLDFAGPPDLTTLLALAGRVPLPPYIRKGSADGADTERYQTTFARDPGAVAAPTAGLHFSPWLLAELDRRGMERVAVTLHVGPGTFLPVRTQDLRQHQVLPERYHVSAETAAALQSARAAGRPIIAIGTTVTRVLEHLAAVAGDKPLVASSGLADLTILPGHKFGLVTGLWSNFHLPQSSLLVLVSAFAGRERVLAAYNHAVASGYRFYSYGDATLWL
jgi:S-adenosylmethionine:tRNA ribosyltransferase-isomerase